MSIISGANNGFGGYRADDHGNTISSATALSGTTTLTGSGIIAQNSDIDVFSFPAGAGPLNFTINPAQYGPNLDILAELINSSGNIIATSNPTSDLFANINTSVSAGNYFLPLKVMVSTDGRQYTISGTTRPVSVVNDNFANGILLGGLPVSTTGSNIGATEEPQEPAQSGPINSVWWSWTAPTTETVNINTIGSNFDTYLSVFTGSALPNLTLISANDDAGGTVASLVSLNAIAGTTYQIAVDGYSTATGQIALNIVVPPPPNDNFANRITLTGDTATTTGSNRGATGEAGEPSQSGIINSAWWEWTAPTSGLYNIDTRGSNFDTYLSVFTGSTLGTLTLIGANDDSDGTLASRVSMNAIAGTTYRIAVDGFSTATGQIALNIAPPPPPNDNFANRIALTGETATTTGSNRGATGEVGEPAQSGTN